MQGLQFGITPQQAAIELFRRRTERNLAEIARYQPRGASALLQSVTAPEVLISGPAGTGKSRAALQKLHAACIRYDGARCLIIRKTRASLSESALFTFEEKVLGSAYAYLKAGPQRPFRFAYRYPNGSQLVVGGMDNATRIMSTEYDLIFVQEATELNLYDWESLSTRLRNGRLPYQQMIGDANPNAPKHWLKVRCDTGKTLYLESRHEDNPVLWNTDVNDWTPEGREYIAKLDQLTGMTYQRLRLGKWTQAEGVIYDNFEAANITTDAEYVPGLPLLWGVDDGYAYGEGPGTASYHPRVVLLAQVTPLGGLNVFAEYVKCGVADYQDTINEVRALGYGDPDLAYVDSSAAMFRGALSNASIYNVGATHKVEEGIRNVRRLICDGNGVRLLRIHPRCTNLIRELQSYRYDDGNSAANGERKPLKVDDHVVDATRYMAQHVKGSI